MIEMQENFKITNKILFTAIKLVDQYLDKIGYEVEDQDMGLIGSSAFFTACSF